jgi:hypothetical protein
MRLVSAFLFIGAVASPCLAQHTTSLASRHRHESRRLQSPGAVKSRPVWVRMTRFGFGTCRAALRHLKLAPSRIFRVVFSYLRMGVRCSSVTPGAACTSGIPVPAKRDSKLCCTSMSLPGRSPAMALCLLHPQRANRRRFSTYGRSSGSSSLRPTSAG